MHERGRFSNNGTFELGCSFEMLQHVQTEIQTVSLIKQRMKAFVNTMCTADFLHQVLCNYFSCTQSLQLIIKKEFMENMCSFCSITLLQPNACVQLYRTKCARDTSFSHQLSRIKLRDERKMFLRRKTFTFCTLSNYDANISPMKVHLATVAVEVKI